MHLIDLIKGLIEINLRLEFNLTKIKRINKFWIDLINAIKELIKKKSKFRRQFRSNLQELKAYGPR
jgi:hypothetical protein